MEIRLNQDALDEIRTNPALFGKVAELIKVSPLSMAKLIRDNDARFTQVAVLRAVAEVKGIQNTDELLEMQTIQTKLTDEPA